MPRLLDLFCGAGGAAMGYHRAGWEVVGVDLEPQPRYPFEFHQADALTWPVEGFDLIHASPPCQAYTRLRSLPWLRDRVYWDSIPPTRARLLEVGLPYVMENVEGAPVDGITLCGQMFGLRFPDGRPLYRHRLFETSTFLLAPGHPKHFQPMTIEAERGARRDRMALRAARCRGLNNGYVLGGHQPQHGGAPMGINWMRGAELAQAIPPAYTQWLGEQLWPVIVGPDNHGKIEP